MKLVNISVYSIGKWQYFYEKITDKSELSFIGISLIVAKIEPHLRNVAVSSFRIAQRVVKAKIIDNARTN